MQSLNKPSATCFWQPSRRLSCARSAALLLACAAVFLADINLWLASALLLYLSVQLFWQLYGLTQQQQPQMRSGVRRTHQGWQMWNSQQGWRAVQLRRDSMALPSLVLLGYRYAGQWWYRSAIVPSDSLTQDEHRRLRVRLKFSRQPWQAVK